MKIALKTFANIQQILGSSTLAVELPDAALLADLFTELSRRYGAAFDRQIRDQVQGEIVPFLILINEKTLRSTVDMAYPLNDGDSVTIMIPFDGG